MTDQEIADKLKARLSAWQGYMEQAQSRSPWKQTEDPPAASIAPEILVSCEAVVRPVAEPALLPESLIERYEQQIADLRAALEHERNQSRCLAETLAREQALRATSPPPTQNTVSPASSHRLGSDRQYERYNRTESEMRSQVLWLFILLIGIVCCLGYFAASH